MVFRKKSEIEEWLSSGFIQSAGYDQEGNKYYFVFPDMDRGGIWTLMKYSDRFTLHGRGEDYCDQGEIVIEKKELVQFIWANRKAIHTVL